MENPADFSDVPVQCANGATTGARRRRSRFQIGVTNRQHVQQRGARSSRVWPRRRAGLANPFESVAVGGVLGPEEHRRQVR